MKVMEELIESQQSSENTPVNFLRDTTSDGEIHGISENFIKITNNYEYFRKTPIGKKKQTYKFNMYESIRSID